MSYQSFIIHSKKNAPLGEYFPTDGVIHINLDELWSDTESHAFCNRLNYLIESIIDVIIHEDNHKAISESLDLDKESFNEQDERIFRVISDWIEFEKKSSIISYDY